MRLNVIFTPVVAGDGTSVAAEPGHDRGRLASPSPRRCA